MPHTIATQNEKSDTKIEEDDGKHNEGSKKAECRVRRRDRCQQTTSRTKRTVNNSSKKTNKQK